MQTHIWLQATFSLDSDDSVTISDIWMLLAQQWLITRRVPRRHAGITKDPAALQCLCLLSIKQYAKHVGMRPSVRAASMPPTMATGVPTSGYNSSSMAVSIRTNCSPYTNNGTCERARRIADVHRRTARDSCRCLIVWTVLQSWFELYRHMEGGWGTYAILIRKHVTKQSPLKEEAGNCKAMELVTSYSYKKSDYIDQQWIVLIAWAEVLPVCTNAPKLDEDLSETAEQVT
jgi:hypothetical protein